MAFWSKSKMAEEAPQATETQAAPSITLGVNEIVGVIQRNLLELNAYCTQAAHNVDPMVCQAYLERTWTFVQRLPQIPKDATAQTNGGGRQAEKRAN